ncbi:ABC transporter substrate-binding protein [uncultured Victivallis sp.]|uniref:ABC transporter substrate-binding protein n=1 Tax=uncultured Victivallis sp. TaxID=354118 RepID=UPI0025DD4C9F|nr:ABC transporter substrate-binding protein [uncultured Victivallis sp.]
MMRHLIVLFTVAVAAAFAAGCRQVTPLPNPTVQGSLNQPVRIGVLLPLTGDDAEFGERTLRGIRLACDELNNGRGISDRRVELLIRDTKSSPLEARHQTEELSEQGIAGLVGPYSTNEALAIKPVVEALLIPTVIPLATNDEVTNGTRMIYRACFTDSQQGEAIAAYAWYWRKLLRMAILVNVDKQATYSRSVAQAAGKAFAELGGEVVHSVEFKGDKEEFVKKLQELVSYGPQAILVPGEPGNSGRVVKYIRELGYRGLLLGPESWDDPAFLRECGPRPGDCAFIGFYSDEFDLPEQHAFRKEFRRTNFIFPGSCEAQGYDALKLLAIGLSRAASVEDFNRNMLSIRNLPGAAALYTMKPGGGIDRTMFIKTIRPAATPTSEAEFRLGGSFNMSKIYQLKED